jgi:signal transduction histidine kinase
MPARHAPDPSGPPPAPRPRPGREALALGAAWGGFLLLGFALSPASPVLAALASLAFPLVLVATGWTVRWWPAVAALAAVSALLAATGNALVRIRVAGADSAAVDGAATFALGIVFLGVARAGRLAEEARFRARAAALRAEAAQERERELALFLRAASHEVANHLTPLGTEVEALALQAQSDPALQARLDRAVRSLARMRRLVRDIGDAGRTFQGRLEVLPRDVDLAPLVRDTATQYEALAGEQGVHLQVRVPETLRCHADPDRIGQAVANLLQNALRYTPRGGRVRLEARQDPGGTTVAVADSGVGLSAEERQRLFRPLARLHPELGPGMGLGLWITQGIARAHGGAVTVESEGKGKGATFVLRIPVP